MIKRNVAIVLFYDNGNILIQDRKTYSKHGEEYGFFGGRIEENETPEQALKRELKEELGINIEDFKFFKDYKEKIVVNEWECLLRRIVFLAPIPGLKKLRVGEGKLALMKFENSFNLKMIPGDFELLKEIYRFLKQNGN